jgi:hypothetical protein
MATKSNLGASVPKPANQGGHSGVNYKSANIQAMPAATKPGPSTIKYSAQPSGTKGTNKGAK